MKFPIDEFVEQFAEVVHHWNLDKLYDDITDAKQRQGILRRKSITLTEKACLRGLLSNHSPSEIALKLNRNPIGLRVDLSRGLYRYIEMLTDCSLKDWSKVSHVLASAGYRIDKSFENLPLQLSSQSLSEQSKIATRSLICLEDLETRWIGRELLINKLIDKLQGNCRILSLVGITGIGKSALAIRIALEPITTKTWSAIRVICCDTEQHSFEGFAKKVLEEKFFTENIQQINPDELSEILLAYLRSQPCLIILDMLENILISDDRGSYCFHDSAFATFFDRLIQVEYMPSRFIFTSQDRVPVMAEGRYQARSHVEHLKGLDTNESLQLLAIWGAIPTNTRETEYLHRIIQTYQGHPLTMQIIAGEILEFTSCGNVLAYWKNYGLEIIAGESKQDSAGVINTRSDTLAYYTISLSDLVKSRIERSLHRLRTAAPLAYLLLCLGSAYHGSVERADWLSLIAGYPRSAQILAFQTLQRSFLLDIDLTTGKVFYRMHSLIRSVARQHLDILDKESVS